MLRRLMMLALDAYLGYLVIDMALELRGRRPEPEPFLAGDPRAGRVEVLDRDGHLLAVFVRD